MRINWRKIDVIPYHVRQMSEDAYCEYSKALDLLASAIVQGDKVRIRYLTKRLTDKCN